MPHVGVVGKNNHIFITDGRQCRTQLALREEGD